MTKSKSAFLISTQILGKQPLYMWTFTFAEVLNVKDTRKRWNHLLTLMRQRWPQLSGMRVFELHEFHGLHVHLATNRFLDVNEAQELAKQAGWGRIDVQRIPVERAAYLAKYLSKERPPCLKRWRLWAGFGEWEWTKVKDLITQSRIATIYRACKEWLGWTGRKGFFERMKFVAWLEFRSAVEGWSDRLQRDFGRTGRLLPIRAAEAAAWGELIALRPLPVLDGFLAATAQVHSLTLATRNEADFAGLSVQIENPLAAAS